MTRPFRLTAPVPLENDIHAAIADALDLLLLPPTQWSTFPAGHCELTGRAAAKLARLGLKRSWPDILVIHDRVFGIEIKRPGGRLSITRQVRTRRGSLRIVQGQREHFPRLVAAGMQIAICASVDDAITALAGWGVPLRGHSR